MLLCNPTWVVIAVLKRMCAWPIDFYGSTLVGIPVLRAGFNDRLASSPRTTTGSDDVFALEVDPNVPITIASADVPCRSRRAT